MEQRGSLTLWFTDEAVEQWYHQGRSGRRGREYTYDADHAHAMDMAVARYTQFYGEAPEAEIMGKLAMVSDLEADD